MEVEFFLKELLPFGRSSTEFIVDCLVENMHRARAYLDQSRVLIRLFRLDFVHDKVRDSNPSTKAIHSDDPNQRIVGKTSVAVFAV